MVRQVGILNCTAVGPGSNLNGGAGYLIYPFMASAPDDHSFNPLPTKNILEVVNSFMARAS